VQSEVQPLHAFVQLITFTTFTVYSDVGAHGSSSLATGSRVELLCVPCLLSEDMEGCDEVGYTNMILKNAAQDTRRARGTRKCIQILVGKHEENKTAWDRRVFRMILKRIIKKQEGYAFIKFVWIRIRTHGGFLSTRQRSLGFHRFHIRKD
jgi:hypothetical protein